MKTRILKLALLALILTGSAFARKHNDNDAFVRGTLIGMQRISLGNACGRAGDGINCGPVESYIYTVVSEGTVYTLAPAHPAFMSRALAGQLPGTEILMKRIGTKVRVKVPSANKESSYEIKGLSLAKQEGSAQ